MQDTRIKKYLYGLILFMFSALIIPLNGAAQPPETSTAIENRLFQGTTEEITTFVNQRQEAIDKIIRDIDKNTSKNGDKDSESSSTALKDLFQGLSLQHKSLLKELSRTASTIATLPQVAGPPYDIESFDKIIAFQKQISLQLADNSKKFTLLQSRLTSLKENAVSQLSEYAKLIRTAPEKHLLLYEKYGKLLKLQSEYALLQIKKPKLEEQIAKLNREKKIATTWIKEAFSELKVTPDDISKAQQIKNECQDLAQKAIDATSSEHQELNSRILIYEAQLDEALARLESSQKADAPGREEAYIEKERIELILDALKLRLRLITQKRLNCDIKLLKNNFRLQWLNNFESGIEQTRLTDFIKEWSLEVEKLTRKQESITTAISEVTLTRSNLTQKQVTISNKESSAVNPQTREALAALGRQASKVNENIDILILALSENDQELRNAKRELEQIIALTRFNVSLGERIRTWSAIHLVDLQDRALEILYFPLFSIGTSSVTLLIITKIVFLLFLGIILLRLLRRKITHLLEKKGSMSSGAINSITTLGYYAGLLISSLIILSTAGLDLSQLSIILGALGVGIGFGLQTITNNFISGIILLSEQTVKVGDLVTLGEGIIGEVKKMAIRATVVRTVEGEDVIVPNSEFISGRVNTWTYGDDWRRLTIPFGVSYASDPDEVVQLAEAAAREVEITQEDFMHPLRIFFEGFGDNSLDFSIRVWCRMTNLKAPSGLKSDYYFALFRKFKDAGIVIPFPQRDLHLQSASPEMTEKLKTLMAPEKRELNSKQPGKRNK